MQFSSVPWNSSEISVDAAPGHSQHQQFWGKYWDPSHEQVQKPLLRGKIPPKYQVAVCRCEKHSKVHPGAVAGALRKAAAQAVQLSSQGKATEHMGAFQVSPRCNCWQMCSGKRWHQSKLKCSAKISFFFPNKPRTCSNSRGTSTAFFFTSLSKSYKIKPRKYCQNSVQALHPNNTAHSKVLKHPANKHFKSKKPHCCSCFYLTAHFPGLPWFWVTKAV